MHFSPTIPPANDNGTNDHLDPVLLPRAYELSLNHDDHLRRRLHYDPRLHPAFSSSSSATTTTRLNSAGGQDGSNSTSFRLGDDRPSSVAQDSLFAGRDDGQATHRSTRLVAFTAPDATQQDRLHKIWTDRFDVIHLLSSLPAKPKRTTVPSRTASTSSPPSDDDSDGFSDLPSDSDDLFFLTSSEAADYLRDKKRNRLEDERQKRIAAILALEQGDQADPALTADAATEAQAGFPDQTQYELMQRTAKVLLQSTNPTVLEMKILANHGSDPRFAFLRKGTKQLYPDVWKRLRSGSKECERPYDNVRREFEGAANSPGDEAQPAAASTSFAVGMGASLVAYDSDSESEDDDGDEGKGDASQIKAVASTDSAASQPKDTADDAQLQGQNHHGDDGNNGGGKPPVAPTSDDQATNELKRKERLERAREWAKRRRAEKAAM
ncbi:uncharacterized protein PFL1_02578 [Pseudozyma flocculosa PF-1]|uniref:SURP motif domain-containing protein n=1 Tax=Pseudozyma flocculosa PF-1 TaxID=1277687 RepID=A0A061HCZ0_9BASI|nr:uncharacterized protein PFL1_02578 [Pseudozyma flocculosa PF-1]EPQ29905.1 hypothetical protein PFL1_02578 [Pseudozyma flocculosa PF-1]